MRLHNSTGRFPSICPASTPDQSLRISNNLQLDHLLKYHLNGMYKFGHFEGFFKSSIFNSSCAPRASRPPFAHQLARSRLRPCRDYICRRLDQSGRRGDEHARNTGEARFSDLLLDCGWLQERGKKLESPLANQYPTTFSRSFI